MDASNCNTPVEQNEEVSQEIERLTELTNQVIISDDGDSGVHAPTDQLSLPDENLTVENCKSKLYHSLQN